ncbi:MAG: stage III sporulation protein AE [Oscillospiraceae bacterium]|jgi:stage III sporulation protein AE|nr:stage III sporulation protein AE [Oscillospiraceae bacterium]
MPHTKAIFIRIFVFAVMLFALTSFALAAEPTPEPPTLDEVISEQADAIGVPELEGALPPEAAELTDGLTVLNAADTQGWFGKIIGNAWSKVRGIVTASMRNAAVIVLAAMFSGIFVTMLPTGHGNYAVLAGVLAISAVSLATVNTFIGMGARVLDDLVTFSRMLLPTLAAASAASGAITSASVKYAATTLFLNILITGMRTVIMPLIYAYCAVSVAESAVGTDALAGVSNLIKWLVKTLLTGFSLVFVVYMSITGVIASTSDAAAVKATKTMISTVLPVVGSILADAADTVLSGAAILRGAVGVFGVLAVVAVCAVPFLKLGVNYLLFKAAGGLSGAVADSRISKLINAFGTAFGMTLAMAGVCAVMLFVAIISTIRFVT